jgi:rfaE bifunctional protein kinase chain/domain
MNSFELSFPSRCRIGGCRILVVGDVMLDRYWHGDVERISPEAPVPVVHIKREVDRLGGAANVALNISTLGAQVSLLSTVGTDLAALSLHKLLQESRVESELVNDPSMETIVKLRVIGRSHQMLRIDFEKVPNHALSSMLERFQSLLMKHDVILFSDYGKGVLQHISKMISMARIEGKPVLIDPKGNDWARYSGATVITPNRAELVQVIGSWDSETQLNSKAQDLRLKLGLDALLLTRSEEGMTLFERDRVTSVPAQAREVADVTGAGDTVISTMALMVACGLSVERAMHWANRAGGLAVAKFGAASLTYDELFA